MHKCKDCGAELGDRVAYCNKCGAEQKAPSRFTGKEGGSLLVPVAVAIIAIGIGVATLLHFLFA